MKINVPELERGQRFARKTLENLAESEALRNEHTELQEVWEAMQNAPAEAADTVSK